LISSNGGRLFSGSISFALVFAGAYLALAPLEVQMPGYGLDDSWRTVLGEALAKGWRFGQDIIFTGGPLSGVYTRYFQAEQFVRQFLLSLCIIGAWAGLAAAFAVERAVLFPSVCLAVGMLAFPVHDSVLLGVPFLTALAGISLGSSSITRAVIALGVLSSSIVTLAKFSAFPLALLSFGAVDMVRIVRRQFPTYSISYVIFLFGIFSYLQTPWLFLPFLRDSLNVSAGYTEAMSLPGPVLELIAFLVAAAALIALIALSEIRSQPRTLADGITACGRLLILGTFIFIVFKAGFVRQDGHTFTAWTGLALAALVYFLSLPAREPERFARLACPLFAASMLLLALPLVWSRLSHQLPIVLLAYIPDRVQARLSETASFINDPKQKIQEWRRRKDEAWARLRDMQTVPQLVGTVDVIPSIQSSLIAFGLDYKPRYSIQEYTTYTSQLIEANRQQLTKDGPTYLLFEPGSIDGRYPAFAEGPLWPDILQHYEPASRHGSLLVLRRRANPLPPVLSPESQHRVVFGQAVSVPDDNVPRFLKAKIRKTLFGSLLNVLWRPPLVFMRVTYADNRQQDFRVVPAIAEAGFFISPLIAQTQDFFLLTSGTTGVLPRIKSITFETSTLGRWIYQRQIDFSFASLSVEVLRQNSQSSPSILGQDAAGLLPLMSSSASRPVAVRAIREGILAEAPVELDVTLIRSSQRISIGYGVLDGAWQPKDGTDGICFEIEHRHGTITEIVHRRCLDPKAEPEDRGVQTVNLPGPFALGDVLRLNTACRMSCAYGWSYWAYFRSE
jgi:hypothetical protein